MVGKIDCQGDPARSSGWDRLVEIRLQTATGGTDLFDLQDGVADVPNDEIMGDDTPFQNFHKKKAMHGQDHAKHPSRKIDLEPVRTRLHPCCGNDERDSEQHKRDPRPSIVAIE